jgi:Mrp family chromosome partitioning ATPase
LSEENAEFQFQLDRFERTDSAASAYLYLQGRFIHSDAHWIAHTAVLLVIRNGEVIARVAPQEGSATATTVDGGVEWSVSFAVRRAGMADDERTSFQISADGFAAVALPPPQQVIRPPMVGPERSGKAGASLRSKAPWSADGSDRRPSRRRVELARWLRTPAGIVVACALAAAVAAAAGIALTPVKYQATALALILPVRSSDPTYADVPLLRSSGDPTRALRTAVGVINRSSVAAMAAQRLGLTEQFVESHVHVGRQTNASFVGVTATADSSALATALADVYLTSALKLRAQEVGPGIAAAVARAQAEVASLGTGTRPGIAAARRVSALTALEGHGDPTIQLARSAVLDPQPGRRRHAEELVLALIAGGLLGLCGIWFVNHISRAALQDERQVATLTGLPILARLDGDGPRPGARKLSFTRDLQGLLTVLASTGKSDRTIAVISPSPGDGKTTVATSLAAYLARRGESVALLDLDLRKLDAHRRLGVTRMPPSGSSTGAWNITPQTLLSAPVAPTLLVGAAWAGAGARSTRESLARALEMVDRVVIDTPAIGVSKDALTAVSAVDAVLIVVALGRTTELALHETNDALVRAGIDPAGIVLFTREGVTKPGSRRARERDRQRQGLYRASIRSV